MRKAELLEEPGEAAPGPNEPVPGQDAGGGGDAREVGLGAALAEEVEQDGRAPAWVSHAKVDDLLDDGGVGLGRRGRGAGGGAGVAAQAGLLEAVDPLVGSPT